MLQCCFCLFKIHSLFALTTLVVTDHTDTNPGGMGNPGDLRFTLNTMNQQLASGFDNYAIIFETPMTIHLQGILPIINNSINSVNISIGNAGSIPTVTIDGDGTYSGFFIPMGNVTIQNMIFQNLLAKGGDGGNGNSGGGGGMGAGSAIYAPATFLNGATPSITLMNVSISNCSAVGGNGGSYFSVSATGKEGGGGGGGFSGNGGSVEASGSTGGAGGGGFGGDGGNVTTSNDNPQGGGGGGGGGIGSRATVGMLTNLGTGGNDDGNGLDGNNYYSSMTGGDGGGGVGYIGGVNGGGGGGGNDGSVSEMIGGGGGGSQGMNGQHPQGNMPPGGGVIPSGGGGGDGGGGGGGGVVVTVPSNNIDGGAGNGGYGGGGGGGAGVGASDLSYTVQGGDGGVGGGGGGGGADLSGSTPATGGNSQGGGGGGGAGPSNGSPSMPGSDLGKLGGGNGGFGAGSVDPSSGGGGGGGGSGLGGAIFVDRGLVFTIQALSGITTIFNATNNTVQEGDGGDGGPGGATSGFPGTALGSCIFLRELANLHFVAQDVNDLLILGEQVSFVDDTSFGGAGTSVLVSGNGTVVYNGSSDYEGDIAINNANFKVNGTIQRADISVCRDVSFSPQRGQLSGSGTLTGSVYANSGTISPDTGATLNVGSLRLSPAGLSGGLGSVVHIEINSSGTSLVSVAGSAELAGILEIDIDANAMPGAYTVLNSSGILGTFDFIQFTGPTPKYTLSYLPLGSPTFVQFDFIGRNTTLSTQGLYGNNLRVANYLNLLSPNAESLGLTEQLDLLNELSFTEYEKALQSISPTRNAIATFMAQNILFMLSGELDAHFTKRRLAHRQSQQSLKANALLADNEWSEDSNQFKMMHVPPKTAQSQIWTTGFGEFGNQDAQDQTAAFHFHSGGFFIAYDFGNTDEGFVGALAGYANASVHEQSSMGNSQMNAGYLSIYGMRFLSDFFIDAAIWGEYMGVDQKRTISYPGFNQTAQSAFHAGQLDLHVGTGYDFNIRTGTIEPFGFLDWLFEWNPSYLEQGAFPYNMKMDSQVSWMLRFETGLNGYNTITCNWGVFIARGKLSYVYKKPHNIGNINAAILGAPASFTVETFTKSQSLISPAIELFWQTTWNGFASITYDGEFGSGYASNQFYGKLGYSF